MSTARTALTQHPAPTLPPAAEDAWTIIVRPSLRAPSGHNTQPWRFTVVGDHLELRADRARALPVVDPQDRELMISCGVALTHVLVSLRHYGRSALVVTRPNSADPDLVATIALGRRIRPRQHDHALFEAIETRRTHRAPFADARIPAPVLDELRDTAQQAGADFHVLDRNDQDDVAALVAAGDRIQLADPRFRAELAAWVRPNWSSEPDGIPGYAFGVRDLPSLLGPLFMRTVDSGKRQAAKDERLAREAPALAVLTTPYDAPADWLAAGRALGLVLLVATAHGVAASFLNQPVEVPDLRTQLRTVVPTAGACPQLLLRLGYAEVDARPTPRRRLTDVMGPPENDRAANPEAAGQSS